jgi:hypothetical protein
MLPRDLDYSADAQLGAGGNEQTCDMGPRLVTADFRKKFRVARGSRTAYISR